MADYWDQLVVEDSREERLQFIVQLGPRMLKDIQSKRAEYLKPLNKLEDQIEDSLRRDYRQILAANNTLTSFLASSSEVSQNRERYLKMFGVEEDRIGQYVDQVDARSEQLMQAIRNAKAN